MALFGNFVGLAYRPRARFLLSEATPFLRRREEQQAVSLQRRAMRLPHLASWIYEVKITEAPGFSIVGWQARTSTPLRSRPT